jgi:hypothetical protein
MQQILLRMLKLLRMKKQRKPKRLLREQRLPQNLERLSWLKLILKVCQRQHSKIKINVLTHTNHQEMPPMNAQQHQLTQKVIQLPNKKDQLNLVLFKLKVFHLTMEMAQMYMMTHIV